MAKDPAFLFYSSDFLSGVSDLTMEERGQYITLLCLQHQKGHLSEKLIKLCLGNATADVLHKFSIDENGLYYSSRLDIEIAKRAEHSNKQRQRAIDGWEKRKATANATALPLENEIEIENVIKNKDENEKTEKLQIPENFIKIWTTWLDYRKAKRIKNYASLKYEQMALQKLIDYSKSDEKIAEKIILESITNSWTGFFELKNLNKNNNGTATFSKNR